MTTHPLRAIFVFGPTCVGKTKLGVTLARLLDGEVLSVDSMQCYRAAGVMTARPQPKEMAGVKHHMIDYLEPHQEPHEDFVSRVLDVLDDLRSREKTPLFVGGSTSLLLPTMRAVLLRGYKIHVFTLTPLTTSEEYVAQVRSRVDDMLASGLLEEVAELRGLEDSAPSRHGAAHRIGIWKAVGYPELSPYLNACEEDRRGLLQTGLELVVSNTVRYGLEQMDFIQRRLVPFLQVSGIPFTSLPVSYDKTAWKRNVERHTICVALDFCHPWSPDRAQAQALSDGSNGLTEPNKLNASAGLSGSYDCNSNGSNGPTGFNGYSSPSPVHAPVLLDASKGRKFPASKSRPTVCIFGGSSGGVSPAHTKAAESLAQVFHDHGVYVVYGGGSTGIMGALARAMVKLSGPQAVLGIIPLALAEFEASLAPTEGGEQILGRRMVVPDMHTRKRLMMETVCNGAPGSGFVALSGGYGTAEELLEVVTWKQLGIHSRAVCVFNVEGFYDGLVSWLKQMAAAGFVHGTDTSILGIVAQPEEIIDHLFRVQPSNAYGLDWS